MLKGVIILNIGGLQKLTLLDFPGRVAATIFTVGCNMRCPFCHNASLVTHPKDAGYITNEELFSFLKKRVGILDGICITGGEPTMQKDLPEFIENVKSFGYLVKLDTNGSNPEMLSALIDSSLIDYVALDIKNSREKYSLTTGGTNLLPKVEKSISVLSVGRVEYELRTTAVKGFHETEDFDKIGQWIKGTKKFFIQNFVDSGDLIEDGLTCLSKEKMGEFLTAVQKHIPSAELRGI